MGNKHTSITGLVLFSILFISINASAATKHRKNILAPKVGVHQISHNRTAGLVFEDSSNGVIGFEYMRRFRVGITIGAEFLRIPYEFRNATTSINDKLTVDVHSFTSKYYLSVTNSFKPFIGLGVGYAIGETDRHGSSIDGEAYQYNVGFAYETDRVGIEAGYKYLHSRIDREYWFSSFNDEEILITGGGIYASVTILL